MASGVRWWVLLVPLGLAWSACAGDDANDRSPASTLAVAEPTTARSATPTAAVPAEAIGAAATEFCDVMWGYVTGVGEVFNAAAGDVAAIDDPDERRRRWGSMIDETSALLDGLDTSVVAWSGDPVLAPLVEQVVRDVPLAAAELAAIGSLLTEQPEVDEQRHQARTQQIIVRLEKVVDLPKPDLADVDPDGRLRAVFREIPSCQHSVRDADDGRPQDNDP